VKHGYVNIFLNIAQPISVVAGTRPPSIFDIIQHKKKAGSGDQDTVDSRTLTSVYLPRGSVKIIHITSETNAHDVIAALLRKFRVVDSPKKFALYERKLEEGIESSRGELLNHSTFE
jgi:Ras association domain-containing protein 1